MIKKRFTLEMQYWKGLPQGRKLFDNLTGQDGMSVEELCNIASDLHSKCEELESVLKVYEDCLGEFEDENKKLQKENEQLKHDATVLIQSNKDYRKENEQLKQELSEQGTQLDFLKDENKHMRDLVNENEQLKKKCEYMEDVLNNQGYEVVFNGERWVIE